MASKIRVIILLQLLLFVTEIFGHWYMMYDGQLFGIFFVFIVKCLQ